MKEFIMCTVIMTMLFLIAGCTETKSTDEKGNQKTEFSIKETAKVNNTKIKINSIKKILKECSWEYDGKCQSYIEPKNNFFLVIDLTLENIGEKDLNVSSIMSFELKLSDGEKAEQTYMLDSLKSQLDGTIMPGDILKGQIAYDVKESDKYTFYYEDSLLDSPVKFIFNNTDIIE